MSEAPAAPFGRFIQRMQVTGGLKAIDIGNLAGVSSATVSDW